MARVRIGELLIKKGRLNGVQLETALAHKRKFGGRLGRSIVELGFMREDALLLAVSEQLGVPLIEIGGRFIPRTVLNLVPDKLLRGRRVVPLERLSEKRRGPLVVAVSDPADLGLLDEIAFATGLEVKPVLASDADLEQAIARLVDGVKGTATSKDYGRGDAIDLPEESGPLRVVHDGTREEILL